MTLFGEEEAEIEFSFIADCEGEMKGDFEGDLGVEAVCAEDEEGEIKADRFVAGLFATVEVDLGMLGAFLFVFEFEELCLKATISTFSGSSPSNVRMSSFGTEKLERQRVKVNTFVFEESITYLIFDLSSIVLLFVRK